MPFNPLLVLLLPLPFGCTPILFPTDPTSASFPNETALFNRWIV